MILSETRQYRLAWLMWCYSEGYSNPEDRADMSNWLLEDPATLTREDVATRDQLLTMAAELLAVAKVKP